MKTNRLQPTEELKPVAEVINSSITEFKAECLGGGGLDFPVKPRFGSFLKVGEPDAPLHIFAVAFNVLTGPLDNVHKPSALGLTRAQLQIEQPQVFSLLKTEVSACIVGHSQNGKIYTHLPPQPPDVHDFVFEAKGDEVALLTKDFEFLRHLAQITQVPDDELLSATIREACALAYGQDRLLERDFLVGAGRFLSNSYRADYDKLLSVLKKIRPSYQD
ncbi:hypothetical protein KA183_02320 [bacterium]|nr:hypothetical protein [bacterium]